MKPALITSGDPAGIGPEIALRAFTTGKKNIIIMGELTHLKMIADKAKIDISLSSVSSSDIKAGKANLLAQDNICPVLEFSWAEPPVTGQPNPKNAKQIIASIEQAVGLVKQGYCSAVITNPIAKSVLYEDGFSFPGHTEFLAHLDGKKRTVMMLANQALRVIPLTIHIPLSDVPRALNKDDFLANVRIIHTSLKEDFGIKSPRISVAGLNPHAGENGHIGTEDDALLKPFIAAGQALGITLSGPYPADTLFHQEAREHYDAVLCMYHDQALIPVKTLDFFASVNITLGLSFIRTSPDHGTAFDRAALFTARPDSLIAAIDAAENMANHKS